MRQENFARLPDRPQAGMRETVSGLAGKGDFTRPPDGQREENAKTGGRNAGGDERNGEKNGREHFP